MPRAVLRSIETAWPELTAAVKGYKEAIERALAFSWGPGFHVDDSGGMTVVHYEPEAQVRYARTTTGGITARSGATLGQGNIVIEGRLGAAVTDGATELCYSTFALAVPHPSRIMVGWDGSAYGLIGADCPP